MRTPRRALLLTLFLSAFALGADAEDEGCSCSLCDDLTGTVRQQARVDDTDSAIDKIVQVDPNDNDDVERNREKIKNGSVTNIVLQVLSTDVTNKATTIRGEIQVRPAGGGDDAWITIVRDWSEVPLFAGNQYALQVDQTQVRALNDLVFGAAGGPLEIRIIGNTNDAPVRFDFELSLDLEFEGCV